MYHAISHVWGSPDDTVSIIANGQRMKVRRNREYALEQSAWYGGAHYIWCDAICIDQTDDDEKMPPSLHDGRNLSQCAGRPGERRPPRGWQPERFAHVPASWTGSPRRLPMTDAHIAGA